MAVSFLALIPSQCCLEVVLGAMELMFRAYWPESTRCQAHSITLRVRRSDVERRRREGLILDGVLRAVFKGTPTAEL